MKKYEFSLMMWELKSRANKTKMESIKKNREMKNKNTDFDYKKEHEKIQELNQIYLNKIRNNEL